MSASKQFTLEQARKLIPSLREMIEQCNDELNDKLKFVKAANDCYEAAEKDVDDADKNGEVSVIRQARYNFQNAIKVLAEAQDSYLHRLNLWVDRITDTGVILRDLHEGLLDFPCEEHGFSYHLCWRKDESDINFWHLANDGFVGRKPLAVLAEYRVSL